MSITNEAQEKMAKTMGDDYELSYRQYVNLLGVIDSLGRGPANLNENQIEEVLRDIFDNVCS